MTQELIITLVTAFVSGGLSTPIFNYLSGKRRESVEVKKQEIENDITLSDSWKNYAKDLEGRLEKLESDHNKLKMEYFELSVKYNSLQKQLDERD